MTSTDSFELKRFEFNNALLGNFYDNHYVTGLWPLVYILSDEKVKTAYVGETADAFSRMAAHLKNSVKNKEGNTSVVKKEETGIIEALGAQFSDLSTSEKKQLGLQGGVKIVKLEDGALSKNVRIREGFVITKVDNKPIANLDEFKQVLVNKKGYIAIEGRYPNDPTQYFYSFGLNN